MGFDIPVVNMIARSGWIARVILFILVAFSIVSWGIIFNRLLVYASTMKMHKVFRKKLGTQARISDFDSTDDALLKSPMGRLGHMGVTEYKRILTDSQSHSLVKDWSFFLQNQFSMAAQRLDSEISQSLTKLDSGLIMLAIISSVAPFLGLLGTVWGIMNSFFEIGTQGSASLPVVAPGIAEALITTIFGLFVAIFAVFFYNFFMHRVERLEDELEETKDQIVLILKRDILQKLFGNRDMESRPR